MSINRVALFFVSFFLFHFPFAVSVKHQLFTGNSSEMYDTSKLLNRLLKNYDYTLRPGKHFTLKTPNQKFVIILNFRFYPRKRANASSY